MTKAQSLIWAKPEDGIGDLDSINRINGLIDFRFSQKMNFF